MYYLKAPKVRSPEVAKSRRSAMARTDYERRKALEEGVQVNVFQFFGFCLTSGRPAVKEEDVYDAFKPPVQVTRTVCNVAGNNQRWWNNARIL